MNTQSVGALKPHPENVKIYNDHADADLIESIRTKGVINPLLITWDNRIINGHRRYEAAQKCGLLFVPVVEFPSHDELDILEALIESNRQRLKTNEQVGREYEALKGIYHDRESKQGKRSDLTNEQIGRESQELLNGFQEEALTSVFQNTEVKPTAKAAASLGVSVGHANKAATVVKAIDKLQQSGEVRQAEQLRKTLNTSVSKAYDAAAERGYIPPAEVAPKRQAPKQEYIILDDWNAMDDEQKRLILEGGNGSTQFNNQKTDNIEWAMWSWNPVTGCKHDCPYCYARDIANRFYEPKFEPSLWPNRFNAPGNTTVPPMAATNIGYKNVFTCSMADLFGRWVPREWIEAVLHTAASNPQWNFLFLTKFPIRMSEFDFPDNAWVGTTVDCQARVKAAETAFRKVKAKVKWLSCEPLLEPLEFSDLGMFQWLVIGGSSESTQTPEWHPPRDWVNRIEDKARAVDCRIYEKTNLLERIREYPGQEAVASVELPLELRYLPSIG